MKHFTRIQHKSLLYLKSFVTAELIYDIKSAPDDRWMKAEDAAKKITNYKVFFKLRKEFAIFLWSLQICEVFFCSVINEVRGRRRH